MGPETKRRIRRGLESGGGVLFTPTDLRKSRKSEKGKG